MPIEKYDPDLIVVKQRVAELLSYALYTPSIEKAFTALDILIAQPDTEVLVSLGGGNANGFLAARFTNKFKAEILYIAVDPDFRLKGLGRSMIEALIWRYNLSNVTAETDNTAVDFYRSIGFKVTSLGEKYPGVERFSCVLHLRE